MKQEDDKARHTEHARNRIRQSLTKLRTYLAQEAPRRLTEADTKANFIEPVVTALGWTGIGTVTREYYVRNSQEFIDYVMFGPRPPNNQPGALLAIEAKALQNELTEKHAAQLVQYCAVEGIEWAALTNARELQFFNTFLKPDLEAKRILKLDLLAFNTDDEFDALFEQLWRLSRESLTEPSGVRSWLNQLRLDTELRQVLLDPSSTPIRQLRRHLNQTEVSASANDLAAWFRKHLAPPIFEMPPSPKVGEGRTVGTPPTGDGMTETPNGFPGWQETYGADRWPKPRAIFTELHRRTLERWPNTDWRATKHYLAASVENETFVGVRFRKAALIVGLRMPEGTDHARLQENQGHFNWRRITRVVEVQSIDELDEEFFGLLDRARSHGESGTRQGKQYYGIALNDLVEAGVVSPGTRLILKAGRREVTEAALTDDGQIEWQGTRYPIPSHSDFARLLGPTRTTLNGWTHWYARLPEGDVSLANLRERYVQAQAIEPDSA